MNRSRRNLVALVSVLGLLVLLPVLLAGCQKKEEPNAPGYYTGPMKPKGTTPGAGQKGGPAKAD